MCGIVGLHLRNPLLRGQLGQLMSTMLAGVSERGPDSAGVAIYGDPLRCPPGHSAVSALLDDGSAAFAHRLTEAVGASVTATTRAETTVLTAPVAVDTLLAAVQATGATIVGSGTDLVVYKGTGSPAALAQAYDLASATGWQGLAHTRMATESAITAAGCHPFSVGADQCLVHNGSFANHASIRRELRHEGIVFDSENDSEVGARFVAARLAAGDDLDKALRMLAERFDGFYTLLVTTADGFAVVRDEIACKPAIIAETADWVAMASEFRALAELPGIGAARIFEPDPGKVYTWERPVTMTTIEFDLASQTVRDLNAELHRPTGGSYQVLNPRGAHAVAAGIAAPLTVAIEGNAGYYCAGMNDGGDVTVHGSAGVGLAENMMSGRVRVAGDASQSAGATGHGGLLVIEGSASMRCGISMKGIDIVVGGDVGPSAAFMAQAGRLLVCGDAGDGLGDSIYEARLYVRGSIGELGADCIEKPVRDEHRAEIAGLLEAAGLGYAPGEFRRYGSARTLYHFSAHNSGAY